MNRLLGLSTFPPCVCHQHKASNPSLVFSSLPRFTPKVSQSTLFGMSHGVNRLCYLLLFVKGFGGLSVIWSLPYSFPLSRPLASPNPHGNEKKRWAILSEVQAKHPRNIDAQMGVLRSTFLCLIVMQTCKLVAASDAAGEWRSATATYSKETDGSLITGNPFSLHCTSSSVFSHFLNFVSDFGRRGLWLWGPSQGHLWQVQRRLKCDAV